jgi:phage terminase small subunit
MPLTAPQERFCQEYVASLNASAAYAAAYPAAKPGSAQRAGARLLKNVDVRRRVAALQRERAERANVKADRILVELARLAFYDARSAYRPDGTLKEPGEWDDATAAAVSGVEVDEEVTITDGKDGESVRVVARTRKVRRFDKNRALELLCRHLGLLDDKLTVNTPAGSGVDLTKLPDDVKLALLNALRTAG